MWVFISIMLAAMIITIGGSLFGHDHDVGHDHDATGHDGDNQEGTVSIFSVKVLGTFIMGFGGGGALATHYGMDFIPASCVGVGVGLLMGAVMYGFLRAMYGHQANSLITAEQLVGQSGVVTTPIADGALGEVNISLGDRTFNYLAHAAPGTSIPRGSAITVVSTSGSQLLVKTV